jgi:hypothetical protein
MGLTRHGVLLLHFNCNVDEKTLFTPENLGQQSMAFPMFSQHFQVPFSPATHVARSKKNCSFSQPSIITGPMKFIGKRCENLIFMGHIREISTINPKMEVLYHIRPYFLGMFPYIGLNNRPYIW